MDVSRYGGWSAELTPRGNAGQVEQARKNKEARRVEPGTCPPQLTAQARENRIKLYQDLMGLGIELPFQTCKRNVLSQLGEGVK